MAVAPQQDVQVVALAINQLSNLEQLKTNIISGKLKPGERLPSVREFALQTKVNPNTMQKALQELQLPPMEWSL